MENLNQQFGTQVLKRTQNLLDFNKADRKGTITLTPKYPAKFNSQGVVISKERSLKFNSFKAKKVFYDEEVKNVTCGIPLEDLGNGNYKFTSIRLTERTIYNLEDDHHANIWHVVRHLDEVEGSPNLIGEPIWIVHNPEKAADKEIKLVLQTQEAWEFIKNLDENGLNSFGRLFNRNPATESPKVIKNFLLQEAKRNPEKIIDAFANNETLAIRQVFHRAKDTGVIKSTIDRGFTTREGVVLGSTPMAAVEFLRKDLQLLQIIDRLSKSLDKNYVSSGNEYDLVEGLYKKALFKTDIPVERKAEIPVSLENAEFSNKKVASIGAEDDF